MRREKLPELIDHDEGEAFVDRKLNQAIYRLEQGLAIDENGLDEAWQNQPEFYYEAAKMLALFVSRRDGAKQELSVTEAMVDRELRMSALAAGEKTTEKELESSRRLDKRVIHGNTELLRVQHSVAILQALVAAFDQRSKALKGMSDLYTTNYFQSTSAVGGENRMKDHRAEVARREMAQDRRRRGL